MDRFRKPLWLAIATMATSTLAQFSDSGSFGPGGGTDGFGNPIEGAQGFGNAGLGFDIAMTTKQRTIHGILASIAFVALFPLGAVSMATVKGRWAFWVHLLVQMVGLLMFIAAAVLGFLMLREVRVPGSDGAGWLIYDPDTKYHPIIGIVVLILLLLQPALGWLHHRQFKHHQRRTLITYVHLVNGRVLIILGIINGGFGLKVSNAPDKVKLAYTIVAAVLGGAWLVMTMWSELRKLRVRKLRVRDIWGKWRFNFKRNGISVRMVRIDKVVKTESVDGRFDDVDELYA